MTNKDTRIKQLYDALKPFADIAFEYETGNLDEARPDWIARGISQFDPKLALYTGRGGKTLITLENVLDAKDALLDIKSNRPDMDPFIQKVFDLYNAGIPNLKWSEMSEERRDGIIENYRKIL